MIKEVFMFLLRLKGRHDQFLINSWVTAEGYKAIVLVAGAGHLCGYVGLKVNHPLHGQSYNVCLQGCGRHYSSDEHYEKHYKEEHEVLGLTIDVHGGLTYSGTYNLSSEDPNLWYFGFDCGHTGDYSPVTAALGIGSRDIRLYKDMVYVRAEIEKLSRQLVFTKVEELTT